MALVKSDLENINELIEGYDTDIPLAIYAIAKTGKTLLAIQEAYWLMNKLKKNTLFFSTELGVKRYIDKLDPIFRKRFSVPPEYKIELLEVPPTAGHLEKVAKAFGKTIKLKMGDTGKVDVQFLGSTESPVEALIKKVDAGILIVDSLTKPFKSEEFAGVLKNLPSRATGVNIWLNAIHAVTLKNHLITFVTHHASLDPTNPWSTPLMTGGGDINYDFKIQIYIEQSKSKAYNNLRWIHLVRFFNVEEWSKKTRLWISDDGYIDVNDAFMSAMAQKIKDQKKEREKEKKGGKEEEGEKEDESESK
jgi:archaellum biogenesis ATPase FlaH